MGDKKLKFIGRISSKHSTVFDKRETEKVDGVFNLYGKATGIKDRKIHLMISVYDEIGNSSTCYASFEKNNELIKLKLDSGMDIPVLDAYAAVMRWEGETKLSEKELYEIAIFAEITEGYVPQFEMKLIVNYQRMDLTIKGKTHRDDFTYSAIDDLKDFVFMRKLGVYYIEAINNFSFKNGIYVFIGFEENNLHFVSISDCNIYTVPAAMHGLSFFHNRNLNYIVRHPKYWDMFFNQLILPELGFSDKEWKKHCALRFNPYEK